MKDVMNPERWRKVEQLYHSALEREANQRAAFLAEACADSRFVAPVRRVELKP